VVGDAEGNRGCVLNCENSKKRGRFYSSNGKGSLSDQGILTTIGPKSGLSNALRTKEVLGLPPPQKTLGR